LLSLLPSPPPYGHHLGATYQGPQPAMHHDKFASRTFPTSNNIQLLSF
jgi:hypothetical protein